LQDLKIIRLLVEGMVLVVMLLALILNNTGLLAIVVEFETLALLATLGRLGSQPFRPLLYERHVRPRRDDCDRVQRRRHRVRVPARVGARRADSFPSYIG